MDGKEIITLLQDNKDSIALALTPVKTIAGALLTAIFLRHNTKSAEFEKIKAGKFEEVLDVLLESGKLSYSELYKAKNFLHIAKKADEYYSEMEHNDKTENYDFDWFMRYYEYVGNISDEAIQDLWAKILAGELNEPSKYSLKTMNVLSNLGKKDAELFDRVCSHAFLCKDKYFIPIFKEYVEHCKIEYEDVMNLCDLGLINTNSNISLTFPYVEQDSLVTNNDRLLITYKFLNKNIESFDFNQYVLTMAGSDIASLKGNNSSDEDLILFAKALNDCDGVDICVYEYTEIDYVNDNFKIIRRNLLDE